MKKENAFNEFGSMVFNEEVMKRNLSEDVFTIWKDTINHQASLDRKTADAIAKAMKEWALEKGCTHYCHWFQPLTGTTAEKHDAFIDKDKKGTPILHFSGKSLIESESDASSFPNGGLRATFEARGYSYWDYTSPAFIRDNVLCIPSVYSSSNGYSLDKKGPLLKSNNLINEKATELMHLLGYKDVKYVTPMIGLEQEYFLINRDLYNQRIDLKFTGRTMFGANAPKDQESLDHYFGSIPSKVSSFMKDIDEEFWKLGIFVKTEHNETAPNQFELAPLYADANISIDQNQLIMDILKRTAHKYGFTCLLHEKPFKNVNGSGKHNNYSINIDTGESLFSRGDNEEDFLRFMLFVGCFVKAVDDYSELLRISVATCGNDHRLGGNEAPPTIISIHLGEYIENVIEQLNKDSSPVYNYAKLREPVKGLTYASHHMGDRNRTSPIAFTGNKFEYRMLGSSNSGSSSCIVLNTIMASSIDYVISELKDVKKKDLKKAEYSLIKKLFNDHKRILYSGDCYSKEWKEEAQKRNLPNYTSMIEAVSHYDDKKNVDLLTRYGIFTKKEIEARKNVLISQYLNKIGVEVKTLASITNNYIIPYMAKEIANYSMIKDISKVANKRVKQIDGYLTSLEANKEKLLMTYEKTLKEENPEARAFMCRNKIVPLLETIRNDIDAYETISDKEVYKLPTYSDLLK